MEPPEKRPRRNHEIRASKVRLIGETGEQMGVVWLREALEAASEAGLDLIEVAPNSDPPVCRIMDWGKFRYEAKQRERDQRRKQKNIEVKGLRLRPSTDDHDFMVTRKRAERFLRQGHKVRVEVRFRGREITHRDLGQDILLRLAEAVGEVSEIETRPSMEGRKMFLVLAPNPETIGTPMPGGDDDPDLLDEGDDLGDDLNDDTNGGAGAAAGGESGAAAGDATAPALAADGVADAPDAMGDEAGSAGAEPDDDAAETPAAENDDAGDSAADAPEGSAN